MQITLSQPKLLWALNTVSKFSNISHDSAHYPSVILNAKKKGKLNVSATDRACSAVAALDGCTVEKAGSTTMPFNLIKKIVSALPRENVTLSASKDGSTVSVVSESGSEFEIFVSTFVQPITMANDEEYGETATIQPGDFEAALSKVLPSASTDETRPLLTTVRVASENGATSLVSTDSFRLSTTTIPNTNIARQDEALVPARVLSELSKLLASEARENEPADVLVDWTANNLRFRCGNITVSAQLVAGDYPNYKNLFPDDHTTRLVFNKQELLSALNLVRPVLHGLAAPVCRMETTEDNSVATFTAQQEQVGTARSEAQLTENEGESLNISFNAQYLAQGVAGVDTEQVDIRFNGANKPILLRPMDSEDNSYLYLQMPVRA